MRHSQSLSRTIALQTQPAYPYNLFPTKYNPSAPENTIPHPHGLRKRIKSHIFSPRKYEIVARQPFSQPPHTVGVSKPIHKRKYKSGGGVGRRSVLREEKHVDPRWIAGLERNIDCRRVGTAVEGPVSWLEFASSQLIRRSASRRNYRRIAALPTSNRYPLSFSLSLAAFRSRATFFSLSFFVFSCVFRIRVAAFPNFLGALRVLSSVHIYTYTL